MELFDVTSIYAEFKYPAPFLKAVDLNLVDFDFWYLMTEKQVDTRLHGLMRRYPNRKLVPFARRDDSDDIACFEVGKGTRVQIIHDFSDEGYEQRGEYDDFWEWMESAIKELIEREND